MEAKTSALEFPYRWGIVTKWIFLTSLKRLYVYGNQTVYREITQQVGDLDKCGVVVKVVIMDCTSGGVEKDIHPQGHLGVRSLIEVKKKMEKMGVLAPDCIFIATHFSHGGGLLHHELEEKLNHWGIIVAYDGMEAEG